MKSARLQRMNQGSKFRAFSLRSDASGLPIDPILGVDHAWMSGPTFPAHPHAGFSAVSYLFLDSETGVANEDSLGHRNLIQPGGLHWTASGSGIVHEEVPAEIGKTVHMLQIFINLPAQRQSEPPFVFSIEPQEIPVIRTPGVKIRVPLGSFGDICSPAQLPTQVTLLDISLEEGASVQVPIPPGETAFVLPIDGEVWVDDQPCNLVEITVPVNLPHSIDRVVTLSSRQGSAKAVLFSGKPLGQEVHRHGPLALASQKALGNAIEAYQRGQFGTIQPH